MEAIDCHDGDGSDSVSSRRSRSANGRLAGITREELQKLLERRPGKLSKSVVSHLRFRLRSIFDLAISEGAVDRNPATELYTPRIC